MYVLSRETAVRFLALAGHTVGDDKSSMPVLKKVLLDFTNNHVQCRAMNQITSVAMDAFAETNGSPNFSFLLPHKLFSDLLAKLKGEFITLTPVFNPNKELKEIKIVCGNFKGALPAEEGENFPDMPMSYHSNPTSVPSDWLATIHKRVAFAASTDSENPLLRGVYLYTDGEEIKAAATDGFRMAESRLDPLVDVEELEVIVPAQAFKVIFEAAKSQWFMPLVDIGTTKDGNNVLFQSGDVLIASRVVNGRYPPYERFAPNHPLNKSTLVPWTFGVLVSEIKDMVGLAAITAQEDGKMTISLVPNSPNMVAATCSIQSGAMSQTASGESTIPVKFKTDTFIEAGVSVAMNVKFFADSINAVTTEHVSISLFSDKHGVMIETPTWKSVVQPMPL